MLRPIVSVVAAAWLMVWSSGAWAMGLRSFVALPLEKGGIVLRLFNEYNADRDINVLSTSLAYGISGKQTLFLALPYRLSPSGGDRLGNLNVLYRHVVWQVDDDVGTSRLGLLGGAVVPTDSDRDPRVQAGAVATFFRRRYEWDLDVLWVQGLDDAPNAARYDISWQYRLTPATYPEWGAAIKRPGLWYGVPVPGPWDCVRLSPYRWRKAAPCCGCSTNTM